MCIVLLRALRIMMLDEYCILSEREREGEEGLFGGVELGLEANITEDEEEEKRKNSPWH